MIYIKTQIKSLKRQINTLKIDFMEQELKEWLRARWKRDNIAKYQQYFEAWYENLTESQKIYFAQQKKNIENGSLTNWITKK
jgi:hypothetical protein